MVPPTVIVGVGGQGSAIAKQVKQRLLQYAGEGSDPDQAQGEVRRSVRVFAVDTKWDDKIHPAITDAGDAVRVRTPRNASSVVTQLRKPNPGDDFFGRWWPTNIHNPGNFLEGAGGMRAKGRLAYYLDSKGIADSVSNAVVELLPVNDPAYGATGGERVPVFVILVGSLSGGTGSGIMLTLGMHIRAKLAHVDNVYITAAIPLASIMQHGPAKFQTENVWANCSAALRELEWWMTPPLARRQPVSPFFQVGRETIPGGEQTSVPFDLCYLYTQTNRESKVLAHHTQYTELIADSLALDIGSGVSNEATGSLSNFIQQLTPVYPPETPVCKPTRFGSTGSASLEYPVAAIKRYLGLQLMSFVLGEYFLSPSDLRSYALNWVATHQLEERQTNDQVHDDLKQEFVDPKTKETIRTLRRPGIQRLEDAGKNQVRGVILSAVKHFDERWMTDLDSLLKANFPLVVERHNREISDEIASLLGSSEGDGWERVSQFLRDLKAVLQLNRDDVDQELHRPGTGRIDAVDILTKELNRSKGAKGGGAIQILEDSIGMFRSGKSAKNQFLERWWKPYVDHRENIAVARVVLQLYDRLIQRLERTITAIDTIEDELRRQREALRSAAMAEFGSRRGAMLVLEQRVLDDSILVDALFSKQLEDFAQPTSQASISLARDIISKEGGIIGLLTRMSESMENVLPGRRPNAKEEVAAVIEKAVESASNRFQEDVSRLSLWDALEQEALLRRDLDRRDGFIDLLGMGTIRDAADSQFVSMYINARVRNCIATATPFWELDGVRLAQYGQIKILRDGLVSFSDTPLQGRDDLRTALGNIIRDEFHLSAHPANESPHRLIALVREAGAPLFMLDDGKERGKLLQSEANWKQTHGHVYMDQRYVGVLPDDFDLDSLQKALGGTAQPAAPDLTPVSGGPAESGN